MVILRCLVSLNLNCYKSYDTKQKNSKRANLCFWTKLQKNENGNISVLCYNFWTNQNLDQLRPVKPIKMTVWSSFLWKMNIHIVKKWPEMVEQRSHIKGHSFPYWLYMCNNIVGNWTTMGKPFEIIGMVNSYGKVLIFWEGQKIWKNLPLKIWHYWVASNLKWMISSNFVAF